MSPLVEVDGLAVRDARGRAVLDRLSLSVQEGGAVGIVGESGSGKTTLALAMLGEVRPGLSRAAGTVRVGGRPILPAPAREVRRVRRDTLAHLGQDPAGALTPSMRVGRQVAERMRSRPRRHEELADLLSERLAAVGLPRERDFLRRHPHQLSGGQRQRVALARALASDPRALVLDEPTSGLDVVTQSLVLDEIDRQRERLGLALVVVSHDLAVVARLADELLVLQDGRCIERGPVVEILSHPAHPHTAELVAARPDVGLVSTRATPARRSRRPLLDVDGVTAVYRERGRELVAAEQVSLIVARGACTALVGSSGSGKTTIGRCIVGLHRPQRGTIAIGGETVAPDVRDRTAAQRRRVQLIPQDPLGSLNPRRRVGDAIARPLRVLHDMDAGSARGAVAGLLERVRLAPTLAERYPSQLSGGQRQRVAIARALAAGPQVLVCDEITSALDTGVQATVLDLIDELRRELGLAVLLISHDLGVVARVADHVVVLDEGRVVEQGPVGQVLVNPSQHRTRALLEASRSLSAELAARAERGAPA